MSTDPTFEEIKYRARVRRGRRRAATGLGALVVVVVAVVGIAAVVPGSHATHIHAQATPATGRPATPITRPRRSPKHDGTPPTAGPATTSVAPSPGGSHKAPPGTTSSAPPTTVSPSPSTPPSTVNALLPVVVCPTTYGAPGTNPVQPLTMTVSVPAGEVSSLAVYTDGRGWLRVLAPRRWHCSALDAADGSSGVEVVPPGESVSEPEHLQPGGTVQEISADQTSACFGCTVGQACPLFAAAQKENDANFPACAARPPSEVVTPLHAGLVAFLDPPGVAGDGDPSGGADPANGVMTYFYPQSRQGSYAETCTLPAAEHTECTTVLNDFVGRYGTE